MYLGLAASLDDLICELVSARQMVAFPLQTVLMTSRDIETTPLRIVAVRDPRIVDIRLDPGAVPIEPGFERVKLTIRLDRVTPPSTSGDPTAVEAKAGSGATAPRSATEIAKPVMAFLMTVGLPLHEEDAFFGTVIHDFVSKSWMTFPSLLRSLGCTTAEHIAEGGCDACQR